MRLLVVFIATITQCLVYSSAVLESFDHAPKQDGSLSFLVIGDWGRRGAYNQSQVAFQMGVIGEQLDIDFVISTGDNFYDNGLKGIDDTSFHHSFTNIYTAPSLQKQWYNVLGNHDYRGDVEAQLSPVLSNLDNRWFCSRSYIVNAEFVEFFFVDTTPFVDKYFTQPEDHVYDWRGTRPRNQYISNLLKANNIDLYMNGHDHCLQHISSLNSEIQFLTSGGGSKAWGGDVSWWKPEEMKFYYDGQGFMSVHVIETELNIAFYDVFGNVLHKWNTSKQLHSTL